MSRNQKDFTYDNAMLLKDAGLVAASGAATVSSASRVLNLGAARIDGRVILDFSAVEADTNNELYTILLQGSNTGDEVAGTFTTAVNLAALLMGDASTTLETVDTAVGRREMAFTNEVNGTTYKYCRIYVIVAGTIATGINFTAFIAEKV